MTAEELRALQAPVKQQYKDRPETARRTLQAVGKLGMQQATTIVATPRGPIEAGLHPATGGDGSFACSGDMLLEALLGCAGTTLAAVATAMNIPIRGGTLRAEGDMDFRGTLGVSKDVNVGFQAIRLTFELDTDAPTEQLERLLSLTKRYCVVYQTLAKSPKLSESFTIKKA